MELDIGCCVASAGSQSGIDPYGLHFLNFIVAHNGKRICGLSSDVFTPCDEVDYMHAAVDRPYELIVGDDRFTLHEKTFRRAPRQSV